jgi:L-alanine-DL-glutamate epimerase-like enolase superfamily enzyme
MKITEVRTTPLHVLFKTPYHWALGVDEGADVVLVEIETDAGPIGIGESMGQPSATAVLALVDAARPRLVGEPAADIARLTGEAHAAMMGCGATPRYASQSVTGLDMALWDLAGKATGQPVHRLLGGAVRDHVSYFAFPQGETTAALVAEAAIGAAEDYPVIYFKIGRGEDIDMANVAAVREVIGDRRMRVDANESWDTLTAIRMIRKLAPYGVEFVEQPTPSGSIAALAHVKAAVDVPIAADQCVYSASEAFEVCRRRAADVIVLGLHETGGIGAFRNAAAVAAAAGVNICLHGVYETGITTCAANQAAATLPNLDDGNQIMWQLLSEDIVASPDLTPRAGRLGIVDGPGFGFELDRDAVARAAERWRRRSG